MKRQNRNRSRQKQINILHTTTRKRNSRKQFSQMGVWTGIVLAMIVAVGVALHFGISLLLNHALFENPRYTLDKIEITPDRFSPFMIRQATGVARGENLWNLNLARITHELENLPSVASARVERHFPDRLVIHLTERQPVVKIVGIDDDLGTRQTFYLDHDCIVLKPREGETTPPLPEIIGLTNAELEPGVRLDQPALARALEILDAIKHTSVLNTSIDIRSIDLSQPLCIKMVTTRETVIIFRTNYIDQQLLRLVAIFQRYDNSEHTLKTIDLTPDQNDPITFYE